MKIYIVIDDECFDDIINSDNWDNQYTPIMSEVLAELDNRIGNIETLIGEVNNNG